MLKDWSNWEPNVRATLMFIVRDEEVLLIRKKTGFGKGKINGPGGKLDPGETPEEAAIRETREELGIDAIDPVFRGTLSFDFVDGMKMHVSVYHATQYQGEVIETEEAEPLWFRWDEVPYAEMWSDDALWLDRMLRGSEKFEGVFDFEGDKMKSASITWL